MIGLRWEWRNIVNSKPFAYFSVLFVYGIPASWVFLTGHPVAEEVGCGWDGGQYCRMFFGLEAIEPYRRRFAPVLIARIISQDPIKSFLILDIAAMVIIALISTYLILYYIQSPRLGLGVAVLFAAVIASSRNTFHHFINAPVLTDFLGLAAVFIYLLGVSWTHRPSYVKGWVGVFILGLGALLGGFSRENLSIAFLFGLLPIVINRQTRWFGAVGAIFVITPIAFIAMTSSASGSLSIIIDWAKLYFQSPISFSKFIGMLLLSVWFWPVTAIRTESFRSSRLIYSVLIWFGITAFSVSVFGGGNLDRILMPAGLVFALASALNVSSVKNWFRFPWLQQAL